MENRTFKGLVHLKNLYLEDNPLKVLPDHIFDGVPNLKIINLSNISITTLNVDVFKENAALRLIILCNNVLTDETFHGGEIFRNNPLLHYLDLSFNKIKNISDMLSRTPYLTNLNLGSNFITQISHGTFRNVTKLQVLNMSRNPLGPEGLSESFAGLQKLNTVDFTGCQLSTIPSDFSRKTRSWPDCI